MNAFERLKHQHREVRSLLQEILADDDKARRRALVGQVARMLEMHFQLEEKVFYPVVAREFKMMGDSEDLVLQSYEEHALAKMALQNVVKTPPTDKRFVARVRLLDQQLAHHIEDEETILFPKVERMMSTGQTEALGAQLERRADAMQRQRMPAPSGVRKRARAGAGKRGRAIARAVKRGRAGVIAVAVKRGRARAGAVVGVAGKTPRPSRSLRKRGGRAGRAGKAAAAPSARSRSPRSPSSNGESLPRRGESTLRHS